MYSLASTTALDIIKLCLKTVGVLGIGQDPHPENINDCMLELNMMLGEWASDRYKIWALHDLACVSKGFKFYNVGPGEDFDWPVRPDAIEFAYVRQNFRTNTLTGQGDFTSGEFDGSLSNSPGIPVSQLGQVPTPGYPIDYPVLRVESMEDYARIGIKDLVSYPSRFFYLTEWPIGQVFFWPIPAVSTYELHIIIRDVLTQFTAQNQVMSLPLPYISAIRWNLAIRMFSMFNRSPRQDVVAVAKRTLEVLRKSNVQLPKMRMPRVISRNGIYNIYSDRVY